MRIRELKYKDAPIMLSWMHDKNVIKYLRADFMNKTIQDVENFIKSSKTDTQNINLAIVSDDDEYKGTVSLKNIKNGNAEFAIVVHSIAMGQGYAKAGMDAVLKKGFEDLQLDSIYWCVNPHNIRAIKFYKKGCYKEVFIDKIRDIGGGYQQHTRPNSFINIVGISKQAKTGNTNKQICRQYCYSQAPANGWFHYVQSFSESW